MVSTRTMVPTFQGDPQLDLRGELGQQGLRNLQDRLSGTPHLNGELRLVTFAKSETRKIQHGLGRRPVGFQVLNVLRRATAGRWGAFAPSEGTGSDSEQVEIRFEDGNPGVREWRADDPSSTAERWLPWMVDAATQAATAANTKIPVSSDTRVVSLGLTTLNTTTTTTVKVYKSAVELISVTKPTASGVMETFDLQSQLFAAGDIVNITVEGNVNPGIMYYTLSFESEVSASTTLALWVF